MAKSSKQLWLDRLFEEADPERIAASVRAGCDSLEKQMPCAYPECFCELAIAIKTGVLYWIQSMANDELNRQAKEKPE